MQQTWGQCMARLFQPLPSSLLCSRCTRLIRQPLPSRLHWHQKARKTTVTFGKPTPPRRTLDKADKEMMAGQPKIHPAVRAREELLMHSRAGSKHLFVPPRLMSPQNDADKLLRAQFDELQRRLRNPKDPEAIWQCYENLRRQANNTNALALIPSDLYRLLVLHFKRAGAAAAKAHRSSPSIGGGGISVTARTRTAKEAQKTWAARVTTVLVDKRDHCQDSVFTRWDASDMMAALNRGERYGEALQELDRCLEAGDRMDPILLNHAVRAWGGLNRLDKAMEMIQDKSLEGIAKPSEYTLSYMLQQFLLSDQREQALEMWVAMRMLPMEDPKTAEGIIRACTTKKDIAFAQTVYDELSDMGIEATVDTLDMMAGMAVSKVGGGMDRAQILQTIFGRMSTQDQQVFRSSTLESILVNFCKKGDMEGAMLIVHLMDHYGIPSSLQYHNALLRGFSAASDLNGAIRWFNIMRREGCAPDLASYRILITTFTRRRRPREAEALFRQMIIDRVQPDPILCNQMLLAYEHAKMVRRCLQLYRTMFRDHLGLNQESFSYIFNAVFHQRKTAQEGGDGLGTFMNNRRFLALISEPIAKGAPRVFGNDDAGAGPKEEKEEAVACEVYPVNRHPYQFPHAESHTTTEMNPRSIFRDMIIVGVMPTTTMYGNILRAFFATEDYAGAYVALRALTDFYLLKPTPKISGIVISWVYAELERRGPSEAKGVTKGELTKLSHMMGRTRGLVNLLERLVRVEKWQQPHDTNQENKPAGLLPMGDMMKRKEITSRYGDDEDPVSRAVQEMGGDLVDLFQRGVHSGSAQKILQDQEMQVDLTDFERWFESYLPRVRRHSFAGHMEEEDPDLD